MSIDKEVKKALDSGKYLITVSYKEVSSSKNDLHHYWVSQNYPKNDLMKTLDHIKNDIYERELKIDMPLLSPTSKQYSNQQTKEFVDNK